MRTLQQFVVPMLDKKRRRTPKARQPIPYDMCNAQLENALYSSLSPPEIVNHMNVLQKKVDIKQERVRQICDPVIHDMRKSIRQWVPQLNTLSLNWESDVPIDIIAVRALKCVIYTIYCPPDGNGNNIGYKTVVFEDSVASQTSNKLTMKLYHCLM